MDGIILTPLKQIFSPKKVILDLTDLEKHIFLL